jgi:hypothetical protein
LKGYVQQSIPPGSMFSMRPSEPLGSPQEHGARSETAK